MKNNKSVSMELWKKYFGEETKVDINTHPNVGAFFHDLQWHNEHKPVKSFNKSPVMPMGIKRTNQNRQHKAICKVMASCSRKVKTREN